MAIAGSCSSRTRSRDLHLVFLPHELSVSIEWLPRNDMDGFPMIAPQHWSWAYRSR